MTQQWVPRNEEQLQNLCEFIRQGWLIDKYFTVEIKPVGRTDAQNRALHMYLGNLAQALNDAGLDMKAVLKPEVDIPWTKHSSKEMLWRPLQRAMYGVESTTVPTKEQYPKIYETLSRHIAQKHGISVEWPARGY